MNNLKDVFSKLIFRTSAICVAVTLAVLTVTQIIKSTDGGGIPAVTLGQFALFLLFSLLLAGASFLFLLPIHKALCLLVHFAACGVAFFALFMLAGKFAFESPSAVFIAMMLYTVLYAVGLGVYLLARLIARLISKKDAPKAKKEAPVYEKRF